MESTDPHTANRITEHIFNAVSHFSSGFIGKRDSQDIGW